MDTSKVTRHFGKKQSKTMLIQLQTTITENIYGKWQIKSKNAFGISYGWYAVRFMWHFGYLLFNFTGNIVINAISLLMRKMGLDDCIKYS